LDTSSVYIDRSSFDMSDLTFVDARTDVTRDGKSHLRFKRIQSGLQVLIHRHG
jgi:hypothetical protein